MAFEFAKHEQVQMSVTEGDTVQGVIKVQKLDHSKYDQRNALAIKSNSVKAFFNHLKEHCPEPKQGKSSSKGGDGDFNTFGSYEEAMDVYLNRPHELRKHKDLTENIKIPESVGNDVFYDVAGDYLDIGRVLEGNPEHFGVMYMGNPLNLMATVLLNLSATWDFSEESLRKRGERLVRLIDWLESQKIRTRIIAMISNQVCHVEIVVKQFEDALDLDALAVVSHSDFFRRMVFRVMEYSDTWDWGYGTSTLIKEGRMNMPKIDFNGMLIVTETQKDIYKLEKGFDKAEKDIDAMLENGEREFSINV